MTRPAMVLAAALLWCAGEAALTPAPVAAQDAPVVGPGDPRVRTELLRPFEAEYEQMGERFLARLVRTAQERPVWSFQMVMEGPDGVVIDHVGHFADGLGFAYRRFGYRAFRPEYLDVRSEDGAVVAYRLGLEADASPVPRRVRIETDHPVFDGTFAYWLLGLLPLEVGAEWRLPIWAPAPEALETRDTAPFRVAGLDRFVPAEGAPVDAWVVHAHSGDTEVRMWVAPHPPYLLRQEVRPPGQEPLVVIELVRMR